MGRWVTMREAGAMLGVSEDTIRRKIRAEELPARQEKTTRGFRWLVEVATPHEDFEAPAATLAGGVNEPLTNPSGVESLKAENVLLREMVEEFRRDKEWFKEQAEIRAREVEQLHILLKQQQNPAQPLQLAPQRTPQTLASATAQLLTSLRRSFLWRKVFRAAAVE